MERISFGYCSNEIINILGEDILKYRKIINHISEQYPRVNTRSFCNWCFPSSAVRIQLKGELSDLEKIMTQLFNEFGVPHFIDRPKGFMDKFLVSKPLEITTKGAYELIKSIFKERGIKLYGETPIIGTLKDNTLRIKDYYPSF